MKSEWNSCQLCVASTSADLPPSLHGCMEPDTHVEIPSHDRLHRSKIGRHIILNRKHVHYFFAQSQANTLCLLSGITYVYSPACWPQSCWSYSLETWNYIYIFDHFSTLTMCLQYKSIPGEDNKVYSAKWNHGCCCPGDSCRQGSSNHVIAFVQPGYSSLSAWRVKFCMNIHNL